MRPGALVLDTPVPDRAATASVRGRCSHRGLTNPDPLLLEKC